MVRKLKPLVVQQSLLKQGLRLFTPREFKRAFDVSLRAAQGFLHDHSRTDDSLFLKLKNGVYALRTHLPSEYIVANRLYEPSYVSLETALAKYRLIPEIVYTVTSVTTKVTQEYSTPWLAFSYQKIKKEAFTGYTQARTEGAVALIAEPAKAVADYLYFVDLKKVRLNDRLNLRHVPKTRVLAYAKLFGRKSLLKLIAKVYVDQRKPQRIY